MKKIINFITKGIIQLTKCTNGLVVEWSNLRHQSQIDDVEHHSQLFFSSSFFAIKKSH